MSHFLQPSPRARAAPCSPVPSPGVSAANGQEQPHTDQARPELTAALAVVGFLVLVTELMGPSSSSGTLAIVPSWSWLCACHPQPQNRKDGRGLRKRERDMLKGIEWEVAGLMGTQATCARLGQQPLLLHFGVPRLILSPSPAWPAVTLEVCGLLINHCDALRHMQPTRAESLVTTKEPSGPSQGPGRPFGGRWCVCADSLSLWLNPVP